MDYRKDPNLKIGAMVDEYENLVSVHDGRESGEPNWEAIARELESDCEWTADGAAALCMLAERYGAFMLRSALALATALEIEDGSEGF
ncbi:hypothetical protein SH661x_001816 [Planctomicrobium sp. SH661]|uniref:hypothetical protein n=1 Tax=Planctomicrobium sp. SH661 TaxID=3448124 RepID=UPI003F5B2D14